MNIWITYYRMMYAKFKFRIQSHNKLTIYNIQYVSSSMIVNVIYSSFSLMVFHLFFPGVSCFRACAESFPHWCHGPSVFFFQRFWGHLYLWMSWNAQRFGGLKSIEIWWDRQMLLNFLPGAILGLDVCIRKPLASWLLGIRLMLPIR